MKKTILVALMVALVATPCFAQEIEPDGDVDGTDAVAFKNDFFRKDCVELDPCNGDFECDGDVDGTDAVKFKVDFFRKDCPSCTFDCF